MDESSGEFIFQTEAGIKIKGVAKAVHPYIGEGEKTKIDASISKNGRTRELGTMFAKETKVHPKLPETQPQHVLAKHRRLKELGIPTIPTLRYDPAINKYLMTDMTQDGKNKIIDQHNPLNRSGIIIKNLDEVKKEIREVAIKAYNSGNGLFLNSDAYSVVVDENGFGKVCVLDLGAGAYELKNSTIIYYELTNPRELDIRNIDYQKDRAESFITYQLSA